MTVTPTMFPFAHDWADPAAITRQYSTDVQRAFDGSEVRTKRASEPTLSFTMRVVFITSMGAGRLLSQWRGATRPLLYYAPLWCDATSLTTAVSAGDGTIHLDATDRPFFSVPASGVGYAMLWRSPEFAEVVTVTDSDSSSLTLSGTTTNAYAIGGTKVVPCRPMWLAMPVQVKWLNGVTAQADLSFSEATPQAGIGLSGASTSAEPASIKVWRTVETLDLPAGNYRTLHAMAFDAAGLPIPDAEITWDALTPPDYLIPDVSGRSARQYNEGAPGPVTVHSGGIDLTEPNPLPMGFG